VVGWINQHQLLGLDWRIAWNTCHRTIHPQADVRLVVDLRDPEVTERQSNEVEGGLALQPKQILPETRHRRVGERTKTNCVS